MPQNPEEPKKEEDSFIREYIKSRPLNRRRLLLWVLTALLLGVVFGGAAAVTFRLGTSVGTQTADEETADASADLSDSDADTDAETAEEEMQEEESETEESDDPDITDYQSIKYALYAIGRTAEKSIVTVCATSSGTDLFLSDYESTDQNMGLVLEITDDEVLILTQYEPLADAGNICVVFYDDSQTDAKIIGKDANVGLAVISVAAADVTTAALNHMQAAVLKTNGVVAQGQIVIAVGSLQGSIDSILDGTVTSNTNEITPEDGAYTIYTTSMADAGSSSGVLINTDGEVIGIMMPAYGSDQDTLTAVSVKELYPLIEKLMSGTEIAYMGVSISTVTEAMSEEYDLPEGVYVRAVTDDSPAYDGGIQPGDIITVLGSTQTASVDDFMDYLLQCRPDQNVTVTVMRASGDSYAEVTCSIKLSEK